MKSQLIAAMRGRDPNNPSDRTAGNPNLQQRLEINSEHICNCLTTVQKDNCVIEIISGLYYDAYNKRWCKKVCGILRHIRKTDTARRFM